MEFNKELFDKIAEATYRKCIGLGVEHAYKNRPYIEKTIKNLSKELGTEKRRPALVLSGGPSLHRNKQLDILREEGFNGYIVAADGAMGHCLRNNIVPDMVLTVDPNPHRIIRWFGDPNMGERPEDDYFSRQDIDPELNDDEVAKNQETIRLVNKFGSNIKLIISTSVTPEITQRAIEAGMSLYWWNPLYDDFDDPGSRSRELCRNLKVPCMTTGGNVGSSCWVFAQAILKSDPVIMVGMDFSYPPGTDVYNTQYYDVMKELFPGSPEKGLIEVYNPHLDEVWLTDPAYYWYSLCFKEMIVAASGKTINCTEGGILFGDKIAWKGLKEALREIGKKGY